MGAVDAPGGAHPHRGWQEAPALRFGAPAQALAGSVAVLGFAVTGITNKSLRAWMTGLLGVRYTITKASCDLAACPATA